MLSYKDIFSSQKSVLFVVAHPDDADVFFAGLVAKLRKDKTNCFFQVLTSGDMGENKIKSGKLAKKREQEQLDSLKLVGISKEKVEFTHLKDGYLEADIKTVAEVSRAIRRWRPEIVCTFDPRNLLVKASGLTRYIMHRDHKNCGQATIDGIYPYARSSPFFPEYGKPHKVEEIVLCDPLEPNLEIDITEVIKIKREMLLYHKSQWTNDDVQAIIDSDNREKSLIFTERYNYFKLAW